MSPRTLSVLEKLAEQRLEQERLALAAARTAEMAQRARTAAAAAAWSRAASMRPDDHHPAGWRHQVTFLSESEARLRTENHTLNARIETSSQHMRAVMEAKQARDILEKLRERQREEEQNVALAAERRDNDELAAFRAHGARSAQHTHRTPA